MSVQDTLKAKAEMIEATNKVSYYGDYRILGTNCQAIPKAGDKYLPENEDHIACLEYQVKMGRVSKKTV